MIACITTELEASADDVWAAVRRYDTFEYVTRGLLRLASQEPVPQRFVAGSHARGRLLLFGVVPIGTHELRVVRTDDAARELYTNEHGGVLRAWNHRITVVPVGADRCRYTDAVEIDAGLLTAVVWLVAHGFFRVRQRRWRRLARRLASG